MSVSLYEIKKETSAPGTVVVSREIDASVAEVWQALTDPAIVSQWFGTLGDQLTTGQSTRLEFGDGDFFALQDIVLDPPDHLSYAWRFLGIGPLDTIDWHLYPADDGSLVTVTDREIGRTPEAALELRKGWLDFSKRLKDFFVKGKPTRYSWRHDFEGSIELAGGVRQLWEVLFDVATQARWLSLDGPVLADGAELVLADGSEPSLLQISNLVWNPPTEVSFHVSHQRWLASTKCKLELSPHNEGAMLSVSHNHWQSTGTNKEYQKEQRKRFSEFWIATLKQARNLVG
jgi:uncharacterized protein YndB with AHSA1/START domain